MQTDWLHAEQLQNKEGSNRMEIDRNRQLAYDVGIAGKDSIAERITQGKKQLKHFRFHLNWNFSTYIGSDRIVTTFIDNFMNQNWC